MINDRDAGEAAAAYRKMLEGTWALLKVTRNLPDEVTRKDLEDILVGVALNVDSGATPVEFLREKVKTTLNSLGW